MWDLLHYLRRQRAFSEKTFGPGDRAKGVIDHIRRECIEVEQAPRDLKEWIDIATLALDGAWRAGYTPEQIVAQLDATLARNEKRTWPDWRTMPADKAIEHIRVDPLRNNPVVGGMSEAQAERILAEMRANIARQVAGH